MNAKQWYQRQNPQPQGSLLSSARHRSNNIFTVSSSSANHQQHLIGAELKEGVELSWHQLCERCPFKLLELKNVGFFFSSMVFRRICSSLTRSNSLFFHNKSPQLLIIHNSGPSFLRKDCCKSTVQRFSHQRFLSNCTMGDARRPRIVTLPPADKANKNELLRALEASLGSPFSVEPLCPRSNSLVVVISGPSGVGKDAVIKRLREVREGLHFVVTATSRAKRPGEVDGKDYYFVSKEEFLSMVQRNELLEHALVYGEYKGIPKQQIRDYMAKGHDIVLRVDIQGAATLKTILGDSAVFIFLAAESELALVSRLIDRKTETTAELLVRVATAKEEMKHVESFDYVVVNAEGKLEDAAKLMESIIDAEKAKVHQRSAVI